MLFTDGSAHPESRIGFGAYLAVADLDRAPEALKTRIQVKRFEETSSTQLEIETLIWALRDTQPKTVLIYTDSQNIVGLPGRRSRMEAHNYCSKTRIPLNHADLYRQFFQLTDTSDCTFKKVQGHRCSQDKTHLEQIFSLVDRASRKALRTELTSDQM